MKKNYKYIVTFFVFLLSFFMFHNNAGAAANIPETVRAGLFFGGSALSSFDISGSNGVRITHFKDNNSLLLFEVPIGKTLTVKKDDSFHIQIGGQYNDRAAAETAAASIKSKGIDSFVSYGDGWFVYSGAYQTTALAQADVGTLVTKLGAGQYTVCAQKKRIMLVSDGSNKLLYYSSTGFLRFLTKPGNNVETITVSGKPYRGSIEVNRLPDSDMTVINIVSIDQYLYGVITNEIGYGIPDEAYKAQAVSARNVAVSKINTSTHKAMLFDICDEVHCQVYGGYSCEAAAANKAIDATAGKVLTYQGQLALTFYSASNGGITEACENVWVQNIPYLLSAKDEYDPASTWEKTLSAADIKNIFTSSLGDIQGISITKNAPSGRVTELVVKGSKGSRTLTKESCRTLFGLKSQLFTIKTDTAPQANANTVGVLSAYGVHMNALAGIQMVNRAFNISLGGLTSIGYWQFNRVSGTTGGIPQNYTFSGKGVGHAVGMSQLGVLNRAKAGLTYDKILSFYYPGTVIE